MGFDRGVQEYRRQSISTASPLDLVVAVYDGAIQRCHSAKQAMESGDLDDQHRHLIRAQQFVSELIASLEMQKGGQVSQNLFSLYAYCLNQLTEANVSDDPKGIDNCLRVLTELRDAWRQIRDQQEVPHAA